MKKVIFAALGASLISTPAFAASTDSQAFDITASVAPECSMEAPATVTLGALSIDEDPGAGALLLDSVASSSSQSVWVSCNYITDITFESANKALVNSGTVTDTTNFTNKIYYGLQFEPTTSGAFNGSTSHKPRVQPNPRVFTQTKEFHDQAILSVTLEALNVNNKRPIAGDYTDTFTITLGTV